MRSQEDFVADASHQLRTPLTALRLRLENLERDVARSGPRPRRRADEADRLSRLVEELLALARPQASRARRAIEVAAVAAAAQRRGMRRGRARASASHGRRTGARTGGSRTYRAGGRQPARKRGRGLPTPAARSAYAGRRDGWVELHVVDEGPACRAEARARAFDRFWHAGSGEGSGLGLAIARRLVEVDEGEIALHEASAGGVDAVVRLRPAD